MKDTAKENEPGEREINNLFGPQLKISSGAKVMTTVVLCALLLLLGTSSGTIVLALLHKNFGTASSAKNGTPALTLVQRHTHATVTTGKALRIDELRTLPSLSTNSSYEYADLKTITLAAGGQNRGFHVIGWLWRSSSYMELYLEGGYEMVISDGSLDLTASQANEPFVAEFQATQEIFLHARELRTDGCPAYSWHSKNDGGCHASGAVAQSDVGLATSACARCGSSCTSDYDCTCASDPEHTCSSCVSYSCQQY